MQLVAADDVAAPVAGWPPARRSTDVELGGPEAPGIDGWARRLLAATADDRPVIADPHAGSFGTELRGGS